MATISRLAMLPPSKAPANAKPTAIDQTGSEAAHSTCVPDKGSHRFFRVGSRPGRITCHAFGVAATGGARVLHSSLTCLPAAQVQGIKRELKRLGCCAGRIDDHWATSETKSSLNRFAKYANLSVEPKNPDVEFLDFVGSRTGRVSPLECGAQKIGRNGQSVARDKEPAKPSERND
jgi:hypothetical protein